ncbi:hypothetical protein [Mycolicibacterium brisbanense]
MPEPGDLVPEGDRWVIVEPESCPNGHRFGLSGGALVSFSKCSCGGHHAWWCKTCATSTYGPPLRPDCTLVTGPGVREY